MDKACRVLFQISPGRAFLQYGFSVLFLLTPEIRDFSQAAACFAAPLESNHPAFLMAGPRITEVSLSLSTLNTAAGCNPAFAPAIPLTPRWASWRAGEGSC